MALFKRRGPDRLGERISSAAERTQQHGDAGAAQQQGDSGAASQSGDSGTDPRLGRTGTGPQYGGTGTDPQRGRAGTDPQRERFTTDQQRDRAAADPQYGRTGTDPQYGERGRDSRFERAGRGGHAVGGTRGDIHAPRGLPGGWLGEIVLGLATLVLGLIVVTHPMHSLNVLAILIGVLLVVSGVYHVVRSMRRAGDHRMWGGITGVLFFLTGIFMLRHVGITLALVALFAGFAFIIAGIGSLAEAVSGRGRLGRLWSAVFGVICLFAGIAAIVTPIHTLARLAIVLGWAFAAMGIMHIIGAIVSRRAHREESRLDQVNVPGQRATEPADVEGAYDKAHEAQVGTSSSAAPRHRRSRL